MSESAIKTWLQTRQHKALLSAWVYLAVTSLGGILVLIPNWGIAFLVCKLLLLVGMPVLSHPDIWALLLTTPLIGLVFVDCRRAERDDMSLIPLWLAREYLHTGPRLILDGWQRMERARQLAGIDTIVCAELLKYLLARTTPTTAEELRGAFPAWDWEEIVSQLRVIDGVILFRNVRSVSLLAPLRLELRQLLAGASNARHRKEEPTAVPVDEPRQLSPSEILGVSGKASLAEIKTAYHNRVKECHPDLFPNLDEASRELAEEWTKTLNAAYAELVAERK